MVSLTAGRYCEREGRGGRIGMEEEGKERRTWENMGEEEAEEADKNGRDRDRM